MATNDGSLVEYHFSLLTDMAGNIAKAQAKVQDLHTDVISSSGTLTAAWQGTSQQSWSVVQGKWNSACDNLKTALTHLSTVVATNSEDMSATETANTNVWQA
jgi:WXG100 family type VII secretion target